MPTRWAQTWSRYGGTRSDGRRSPHRAELTTRLRSARATASGVRAWFERKDYEAPSDIDGTLASLVKKGALLGDTLADGQTLYSPTFLGKKEHHG